MSNSSRRKGTGSTSSGHGALGMGGQPDDARDLEGGHEGLTNDDRIRAVGGASGSAPGNPSSRAATNKGAPAGRPRDHDDLD